jgi:hypothetical protein
VLIADLLWVFVIGNKNINLYFEYSVPGDVKPQPHSSTVVREKYIRAKYQHLSFVRPPQLDTAAVGKHWDDALLRGLAGDSVLAVFEALLCGASASDCLHRAVVAGALMCTVLLVVSGADLARTDADGKMARDVAKDNWQQVILNYISRNMSLICGAKKSISFKPLENHSITTAIDNSGAPANRVHSPQHDALVKKIVDSALNAAISEKDSNV